MKVKHRKLADGRSVGIIEIETSTPGKIACAASGRDMAEVLAKCAALAARIADDPVMAVIMPPDIEDDICELRDLADAALDGTDAIRRIYPELGASKRKLARHLHVVVKKREDRDDGDDRDDDGGVDIVNGRGAEVAGFWDSVTEMAKKGGDLAWEQAKAHRKELAMGLATAAFGPAGGIAAGKAMDLITAAQAGNPEAKKAVVQVVKKSDAGDPKAQVMAATMKKELTAQAATAAAAAATAQPEHADEHHENTDEHHDAPADEHHEDAPAASHDGDFDFHAMQAAFDADEHH